MTTEMKLKTPYHAAFQSVRRLAAEVSDLAENRSPEALAGRVVVGLAALPGVGLARLWLLRPGETCPRCTPETGPPLHLMGSAGSSRDPREDWDRLGGRSSCLALGRGKIGHIVANGDPVHVEDGLPGSSWTDSPEWSRRQQLRGFGGQPLIARGETLGAVAVFTRTPLSAEAMGWLRMVADHAAASLANLALLASLAEESASAREENRRLRGEVREELRRAIREAVGSAPPEAGGTAAAPPGRILREDEVREFERENLRAALEAAGGRVSGPGGAAELLGVKPTTLASRLKAFGLRSPGGRPRSS
jgi:transcriptional regulator with GAF, ATPase, and Fis domain